MNTDEYLEETTFHNLMELDSHINMLLDAGIDYQYIVHNDNSVTVKWDKKEWPKVVDNKRITAFVIMEVTDNGYRERPIEIALTTEVALKRVAELREAVDNEYDYDYEYRLRRTIYRLQDLPIVG